jgi:hypothetical protein
MFWLGADAPTAVEDNERLTADEGGENVNGAIVETAPPESSAQEE